MKLSPRAKSEAERPWHPDFRDATRLPDLRVVRSGTFLSIIGYALAAAAGIYLAQQEVIIHSSRSETEAFGARLASDKAALEERIKLSKEFDARVARIEALSGFGSGMPLGTDVLLALAKVRPDEVRFSSLTVSRTTAIVKVIAKGGQTEELLLVPGSLVERMRASEELTRLFPRIEATAFDPPKEGVLEFDIVLRR